MVDVKQKEYCSGCTACASICPKKCITMTKDKLGFLYPVVDTGKCINCNLCVKVCPEYMETHRNNLTQQKAYAVIGTEDNSRLSSTSGGVFALIAQLVISINGVVFGAAFDDQFHAVRHISVETVDQLHKLQGSKYVQSDLGTSYLAVKEYLEQGRKVLFSGTPCQIDGLKCFLKQEYENLYLLDVVCHGVPAPGVWDEYLGHLEKRKNGKAVQVSFRDKQISWRNYLLKIVFDNGKCYTSNRAQDLYMRGFLHNCYLRPSCYHCKHKGVDRTADLTLADFWGVDEICPEMDDDKGTSLVIVTTQKGKELFEQISGSVRSHEVNIKECVSFNPSMIEPARYSANRDSFEKEFRSMPIKRLLRKYCSLPIHKKVIDKIRRSFRLCSPCK